MGTGLIIPISGLMLKIALLFPTFESHLYASESYVYPYALQTFFKEIMCGLLWSVHFVANYFLDYWISLLIF